MQRAESNRNALPVAAIQRGAFGLLRYFSIAGGTAILLVTLLLSWTYYRKEVLDQVAAAEDRNVVLAQSFANAIAPEFEAYLSGGFGDPQHIREHPNTRKLHALLTSMSRRVPVSKIKIYSPSGIAVYSTEADEIGEDKSGNSAFKAARAGKVVSEFTRRGERSPSEDEIENFDVVSTYIPITGDDARVRAVFELYADVSAGVLEIQHATLRLLLGLATVFAALYGVLLIIVGYADRILRNNEMQIRAKNRELEAEIVARRQAEAALRSSEEAAASANRAKTEFLSSMSHELRTPMNAILGFAQLSLSEPGAPLGEQQRRFVEQILKAGRHLLELINEILDLARIEAGKLVLSVEPVSVASMLGECLPLIQNLAREGDVQVEAPPAGGALRVMADYMRLKQSLLNLLSNAVKYNRRGGKVSVRIEAAGEGRGRISVRDTGSGIPEAKHGELFRPFHRLGDSDSNVEGTGVGLALTKSFVEAMGGKIGFASVPGEGTTFWIELPLADAAQAAPVAPPPQAQTAQAGGGAARSLLYVEDNPANVLLMEGIARRMSLRFLTAHNAELGVALAAAERPDLIVMDINLPQMDGYQALERLRADPATASIPVMALTANAMPKDVKRGLAAGFVRYHTKPLDVDEMVRSIAQVLEAMA